MSRIPNTRWCKFQHDDGRVTRTRECDHEMFTSPRRRFQPAIHTRKGPEHECLELRGTVGFESSIMTHQQFERTLLYLVISVESVKLVPNFGTPLFMRRQRRVRKCAFFLSRLRNFVSCSSLAPYQHGKQSFIYDYSLRFWAQHHLEF